MMKIRFSDRPTSFAAAKAVGSRGGWTNKCVILPVRSPWRSSYTVEYAESSTTGVVRTRSAWNRTGKSCRPVSEVVDQYCRITYQAIVREHSNHVPSFWAQIKAACGFWCAQSRGSVSHELAELVRRSFASSNAIDIQVVDRRLGLAGRVEHQVVNIGIWNRGETRKPGLEVHNDRSTRVDSWKMGAGGKEHRTLGGPACGLKYHERSCERRTRYPSRNAFSARRR